MKGLKKLLLQYGITAAVGLLIAYFVMSSQGLFVLFGNNRETYAILCDAFFVPAAALMSVGALVWIANTGFFDSIAYALKIAAHALVPFVKTKRQTYYDYKNEKEGKESKTPTFILYTGAAFLLLALIFLAIYSSM